MPDPRADYLATAESDAPRERRWGFMVGLGFVPVRKVPLLAEKPDRVPPFVVVMPGGQTREIVLEPDNA